MKIQLFDRGTPKGKELFANIEILCKRFQIDYDPEYVKDMTKVYNMGVQGSTVLLIDNEIALVDKFPSLKDLEALISEYV